MFKCHRCGKEAATEWKACPHCCAPLDLRCPVCDAFVDGDWEVCLNCGDRLKEVPVLKVERKGAGRPGEGHKGGPEEGKTGKPVQASVSGQRRAGEEVKGPEALLDLLIPLSSEPGTGAAGPSGAGGAAAPEAPPPGASAPRAAGPDLRVLEKPSRWQAVKGDRVPGDRAAVPATDGLAIGPPDAPAGMPAGETGQFREVAEIDPGMPAEIVLERLREALGAIGGAPAPDDGLILDMIEKKIEEAVRIHGEGFASWEVYAAVGRLRAAQGDYASAVKYLELARRRSPNPAALKMELVETMIRGKMYAEGMAAIAADVVAPPPVQPEPQPVYRYGMAQLDRGMDYYEERLGKMLVGKKDTC